MFGKYDIEDGWYDNYYPKKCNCRIEYEKC